jgi:hypothetical protein
MKTVFDPATMEEVKSRVAQLTPNSAPQWGKMTLPQMLAHCSIGIQMTTGEVKPPRIFLGRILGPIIRHLALRDDAPMRRDSPTAPLLLVIDDRDFATEHQKFSEILNRFAESGPTACTTHPHAFFGKLTPDQWGVLMYKHLDHHLRQFGA